MRSVWGIELLGLRHIYQISNKHREYVFSTLDSFFPDVDPILQTGLSQSRTHDPCRPRKSTFGAAARGGVFDIMGPQVHGKDHLLQYKDKVRSSSRLL